MKTGTQNKKPGGQPPTARSESNFDKGLTSDELPGSDGDDLFRATVSSRGKSP